MSKNCPFNLNVPRNLKIPSVPVDTNVDIPFVPRPFSGVDYQMGGTVPPSESINNSSENSFYSNKIYQVSPPHAQNTLTPCSIIGEKPDDPNSGPRKCYNIYSSGQNMVGRICTTPGTDGPLYSREPHDGIGINGNADWVRGNQFAVRYDDSMINDRTKYINNIPSLKKGRKKYVSPDQFYPIPNRCQKNNFWYKEYPTNSNYTIAGFPTWKYPYNTTQPGSRNPSKIMNPQNISVVEHFSTDSNRKDLIFWIGLAIILTSLFRGKL